MAPNMTIEAVQTFGSRSTVAQRKEASELRRTLKPLMEKKRRARINDSLNDLKSLILPLVGKDNCRYSKLEKADILEMTVRFLSDLPSSPVKGSTDSYKDGYKACLQRVSALLPQTSLDKDACKRVNDFIKQSTPAVAPPCQNCCGHSSNLLPEIQQKIQSIKSTAKLAQSKTSSSVAPLPNRAQPVQQAVTANMWRPW
ncbi:transcription factor HES-2.1 [Clupea harengus]|uniref:Transcription factor HES-2.1 n=1 Tax=Clupea harengus TaxID=7950 RepID=A0A6P8FDR9_CLUHA|nr:transcription factor HES-2.1 [Clupea harengus]